MARKITCIYVNYDEATESSTYFSAATSTRATSKLSSLFLCTSISACKMCTSTLRACSRFACEAVTSEGKRWACGRRIQMLPVTQKCCWPHWGSNWVCKCTAWMKFELYNMLTFSTNCFPTKGIIICHVLVVFLFMLERPLHSLTSIRERWMLKRTASLLSKLSSPRNRRIDLPLYPHRLFHD